MLPYISPTFPPLSFIIKKIRQQPYGMLGVICCLSGEFFGLLVAGEWLLKNFVQALALV
tara:strand:+ start:184 stop:360 length:177 start_codon:yes stop_codon:yes gene_type:complete